MMNDKEIMLCLRRLKDEGVHYKTIAEDCAIPTNKFYSFTYKRSFPLNEKKVIESYLFLNYKDILYDECISYGKRG